MKWTARFEDRSYSSDKFDWVDLPTFGLLWITINFKSYTHNLDGGDYYWVDGNQYGVLYDGSYCPVGYASWIIKDDKIIKNNILPPSHVMLIEGLMLPDKQWESIRENRR